MYNKKGFTLAEVLITLAILGVIAAVCIPGLINYTNEQELKAAWKKTFAEFSQAIQQVAWENGGDLRQVFYTPSGWHNNNLIDKTAPYLQYAKKCYEVTEMGTCWHVADLALSMTGGNLTNSTYKYCPSVTMADGTIVQFGHHIRSHDCSDSRGNITDVCFDFLADVNGHKGPNILGKDIFKAYFDKTGRVYPAGAPGDSADINRGSWGCPGYGAADWSGDGERCSTIYLYD